MLAHDCPNQKKAQSRPFYLHSIARRGAIEPFEDPPEIMRLDAQSGVSDTEHRPRVALNTQSAFHIHTLGRILHGIVEQVEYGRSQILGICGDKQAYVPRHILKLNCLCGQMMASERDVNAFVDECLQFDSTALLHAFALS